MTKYPVGMRVTITQAAGKVLAPDVVAADPHPEHIAKHGTIVDYQPVELMGYKGETPVIQLDDGTRLLGTECWWTPAKEQPIIS